jgi:transglutaminase-like putative cysteine protease
MAPEFSRALRRVTFVLLTLSAFAVEVAAVDTRPVLQSLGLAVGWVVFAIVAACLIPLPADARRKPPVWVFVFLALLAVGPFAVEPLFRKWTSSGYPLELQMVISLRNMGLGLAACAGWNLCLRLACVASLFLTLFSAAMTNHPAVLVILGLYTAVGSVWLMLAYWSGLRAVLTTSSQHVSVQVQAKRERLPWVSLGVVVSLVAVVVALIVVGPAHAARTLGEWMGTSGGTGKYDPFSRGGINDGGDETSGPNAQSTGMTESESFLNSPLPSLYDVANDLYGPPHKNHNHERSIALDSNKVNPGSKVPPDNLRPNREFPTGRKSPTKPKTPESRLARGLYEVQGRTPLHIRVVAYDTYDGYAWREAPMNANRLLIEKEENSNWMTVTGRPDSPVFALAETHSIKLTSPEGSFIPSPPHTTRFRVGRVNRTDFFGWGHDRILRFVGRKTPSGISVETESLTIDSRKLGDIDFPSAPPGDRFQYGNLYANMDSRIAELAHQWADSHPRGWPQIHAVVSRLRAEYTHDRTYAIPEKCDDPLAHFLFDACRGPDYQFASATAILLRALGYSTRVVYGFYASPKSYDRETKLTPIYKDDVHFWPEVMLPNGDWLVLEPTPGYEVAGAYLPLSERIAEFARSCVNWLSHNAILASAACLMLIAVVVFRRNIRDTIAVQRTRWFPAKSWHEDVRRTVRILERRGAWVRRPRQAGQTVHAWLRQVATAEQTAVPELARLAEWAAYAPELPPPWSATESRELCQRALRELSLSWWFARGHNSLPNPATGATA